MKSTLIVIVFLAAGSGAFAGRVSAESYFPLHVGNTWHFVDDEATVEVQSITRTDVILGRDVFVNSFVTSTTNLGLDQYWIEAPDGDLLLAGFDRKLDGFGVLYEPPLLWLDAPLALGKEWTSSSEALLLPESKSLGTIDVGLRVYEAGPIEVPAGTFDAFGVGQFLVPASTIQALASLNLDGTARTAGSNVTDWYAAGVGDIRYDFNTPMQLTGYELPTPALASTWGRVKQAYRE